MSNWGLLHNISIKYFPGPQLTLEQRKIVRRALLEAFEEGREEGRKERAEYDKRHY